MTIIEQIKTVAEDTVKTVSTKADQVRVKVSETGTELKTKVAQNIDPKVGELKAKAIELKDQAVKTGTDLKATVEPKVAEGQAKVEAVVEEAKKVVTPKSKGEKAAEKASEKVDAVVEPVVETVVDITEETQNTQA